jgi:ubiquinone/menaquinone biosynthesis C-methylase UbiE
MHQDLGYAAKTELFEGRLERERQHFNRLAEKADADSLRMPRWNVDRYRNPSETTEFPLEYAFHLLGDLCGKTVVDLGCGEGLNTVILASLGAQVISVDISDKSLELTLKRAKANGIASSVRLVHSDAAGIPLNDAEADRVLCAAILHHVDSAATARQIHRILKPDGVAVFEEPMTGPNWVGTIKKFLPKNPAATEDENPLTLEQVRTVSHEVGRQGRSRYFGVIARIVPRFKATFETSARAHRMDRWLTHHIPLAWAFASPLVWEAHK